MKAENAEIIYVLSKDGSPLMPSRRTKHIAKLLKRGLTKVVSRKPFVVQMKYNVGKDSQKLYGGTDPGRTNIGNAVVGEDSKAVYKDHVETCNKDVTKHMKERKSHRQASRRGERQARKRLAKKHDTDRDFPDGRLLPGYDEPVMLKDIINTEARFNNRKRPEGWHTPTVNHLIDTHINQVRNIRRILPVTDWTLEMNKFAFMKMDDGTIQGVDFQNGRMRGFADVNEYVDYIQNGKCPFCGKPIEHHHHIVPRNAGGSDLPENILGVCSDCHDRIHTGKLVVDAIGLKKKYGALSVLNQAIPYIYEELVSMFDEDHVHVCSGYETKLFRELNGIRKDHSEDALCIAALCHMDHIEDNLTTLEVKQFRRHNRAIINNQRERSYYKDGKLIAKNRRPRFEQQGKALSDLTLTRKELSVLTVKKSKRYYNTSKRIMPGAEFVYQGERYILTGQLSGGQYYRAYGQGKKNFPSKDCRIIRYNRGLVYI